MGSDKNSGIAAEVDGRLDDLFGDGGGQEADADNSFGFGEESVQNDNLGGGMDADNSLIKDLKSVVLSLEWEISDSVMQKLGEEIDRLKDACKDDKIIVAFLQLLDSLGKYIQKKKAEAHPDSISLLNAVYENLETVMLSGSLAESEKKKMLVAQVSKYKELKKYIASAKPVPKKGKKPAPREDTVPDESPLTPEPSVISEPEPDVISGGPGHVSDQDIIQALQEINKTIKDEFKALRDELKLWRESR